MRAGAPPTHPNSLELFTLFSLPFLHFYNFVGTQGRAGQREESGAAAASAGLDRWLWAKLGTGSLCPFVSSPQNSREGLPGVLPPSLGCLRRKRGESVHPSLRLGLQWGTSPQWVPSFHSGLEWKVGTWSGKSAQCLCEGA